MANETGGVTIYTIGHSNVAADEIVVALRANGIAAVVDVRSVPYSQYTAQFNRETFAATLRLAGIAYFFEGETLGGRPSDPACYHTEAVPKGRGDYLKLVDYAKVADQRWYQTSIDRLIALASQQRTAIMCSEENPEECHRQHLIAQTLLERGVTVLHIRKSGALKAAKRIVPQEQQLSLF